MTLLKANAVIIAIASMAVATPVAARFILGQPVTPLSIVQHERGKYPTPMTEEHKVQLVKAVAARLSGEIMGGPFGILKKDSGNNCLGWACDIICTGNGSQQAQYDILTAEEGAATPKWERIPQIAIRECVFSFDGGDDPIPPPPPPGCNYPDLRPDLMACQDEHEVKDRRLWQLEGDLDKERQLRLEVERALAEEKGRVRTCTTTGPGWVRSLFRISCKVDD